MSVKTITSQPTQVPSFIVGDNVERQQQTNRAGSVENLVDLFSSGPTVTDNPTQPNIRRSLVARPGIHITVPRDTHEHKKTPDREEPIPECPDHDNRPEKHTPEHKTREHEHERYYHHYNEGKGNTSALDSKPIMIATAGEGGLTGGKAGNGSGYGKSDKAGGREKSDGKDKSGGNGNGNGNGNASGNVSGNSVHIDKVEVNVGGCGLKRDKK